VWFGQEKFLVYMKTILRAVNATFQVFMCYVIGKRSWITEESRGCLGTHQELEEHRGNLMGTWEK
jgi:hypothetical protein